MHEESIEAINRLVETIEESDGFHVSGIDADEYLSGSGFDPDDRMGVEINLTVFVPDDDYGDDGDNPYRVN